MELGIEAIPLGKSTIPRGIETWETGIEAGEGCAENDERGNGRGHATVITMNLCLLEDQAQGGVDLDREFLPTSSTSPGRTTGEAAAPGQ